MGRPKLVTLSETTDVNIDPVKRVEAVHVIAREDGSQFLAVELYDRPPAEHTLLVSAVVGG